ncbi:MAG TPA: PKD domain-containing protein [Thermoanaerobaculia bacterium]
MIRKFTFLLTLTVALITAKPAAAYTFIEDCRGGVKWNNSGVTWRPSLTSFPQYSAWYNSVDAMRVAWNSYTPGGNYRINHTWETSTSTSNTDNRNSIVMPAASGWIWGGALAVTQPRRSMCYVWPGPDANWVEMDIAFNPNYTWDTSINPVAPQDSPYNSTLVGIHEHGHGMGLGHEDDQLATMNSYYPNGGVIGTRNDVHPHADDARGDRALYGTASTQRDLAAFAYRVYPGSPGDSLNLPAPASSNRNASLSFQFAIENRGTTDQSAVPVYFYLSSTRNVTTASTFIGSATFNLNSGATITPTAYVTIPATAPTGYQYLGWIIDPLNSVTESDEGNNGVTLATPTLINTNRAPSACLSAYPTLGDAPLSVSFDASCSSDADGNTLSYFWDFGNGDSSTSAQAQTWYDTGIYTVTLTVTDSNGASSVTFEQVRAMGGSNCTGIRCLEEPQ